MLEIVILIVIIITLLMFRKSVGSWVGIAAAKSENAAKLIEIKDEISFSKESMKLMEKGRNLDRIYTSDELAKDWKALMKEKRKSSAE